MHISRETVAHPQQSLRFLHLQLEAAEFQLHRHAHLEITWIQRGQGLRWLGGTVLPFFDGDLVLVGPEVPHTWASHGPRGAGACQASVVQFPADWPLRTGLPELLPVAARLAQPGAGWQIVGATHEAVTAGLLRLQGCEGPRRVAAFMEVLAALADDSASLLPLDPPGRTAAAVHPGAGPHHKPAGRRLDPVLDWIHARLTDDLRVVDAAAVAHVSPATLARLFQRELGKSFVDYVNDARCGWAALRLLQGREPVAHIAQGCGFGTLSNFGEQFSRRHGLSPLKFRHQASATGFTSSPPLAG
jgi:AraC-like DNA-binding protein